MPSGTEYPQDETKDVTALVSRLTVNGVFQLRKEDRLNTRFLEVRPLTVREFLEKSWGIPRAELRPNEI